MMLLKISATEQGGICLLHHALVYAYLQSSVDSDIATGKSRLRRLRVDANSKLAAPFFGMR